MNNGVYLVLVFVSILFINVDNARINRKLLLSVYYESNGRDSQHFILHQLRPAVDLLSEYITLKFVPFGFSASIDYSMSGFECRHGAGECYSNMVQDCTLDKMRNSTDLQKMKYVACEMDTWAASKGSLMCVRTATDIKPREVMKCIMSDKGMILQLDSEYFTSLVKPKFIPAVTLDGTFNQQFQDNALVDLTSTLCSYMVNVPPCAKYYNSQALNQVLSTKPLRYYKTQAPLFSRSKIPNTMFNRTKIPNPLSKRPNAPNQMFSRTKTQNPLSNRTKTPNPLSNRTKTPNPFFNRSKTPNPMFNRSKTHEHVYHRTGLPWK